MTEASHYSPETAPAPVMEAAEEEEEEEDDEAHAVVPTSTEASAQAANRGSESATSDHAYTSPPPSKVASPAPTRAGSFDEAGGDRAAAVRRSRLHFIGSKYHYMRPHCLFYRTTFIDDARPTSAEASFSDIIGIADPHAWAGTRDESCVFGRRPL